MIQDDKKQIEDTLAEDNMDRTPVQGSVLMLRAARAAVLVAFVMILAKGWAYTQSGSVSLLGSLLDSVMDILASLINLLAVTFALQPADDDHRFGHGKAEAIAGMVQAMVIFLSSLLLLSEAVQKIINPSPVTHAEDGILVIILSIMLTWGLVLYQRHVIQKTKSVAISADYLHYAGDILMNAGVLVALFLSGYMSIPYIDPVIGILVAAYLMYNVWQIARISFDILMDREMDEQERQDIIKLIRSHPETRGIHDMKTRKSGLNNFVQFHLELDNQISLMDAHHISDEVEARIVAKYPDTEVLIHADPESVVEKVRFKEDDIE